MLPIVYLVMALELYLEIVADKIDICSDVNDSSNVHLPCT